MAASFIGLFWISMGMVTFNRTFPPQNCEQFQEIYGENLEKYAFLDYTAVTTEGNKKASDGTLQCFCGDMTPEQVALNYGPEDGAPICEYYSKEANTAYWLSSTLGYGITTVNYVIRTIVISLIEGIGYKTETRQLAEVTAFTFYSLFFNTAFLFVLVNANMEEQPINFFMTRGSYPDFDSDWFRFVGNIIVYTNLFNAIFPLIEVVIYWALRMAYVIVDKRCNCFGKNNKYVTNAKTLQQYIDLYAGDIYYMHYKYSAIMNICFCTLIYGIGMPYLYPTAILALLVLYVSEKLMLYYSYRQPPAYDNRLSDYVITAMQYVPIWMMLFGYWMLSNKQLNSNDYLSMRETKNDIPITSHTIVDVISLEGWQMPAWPMLAMAIFFAVLKVFNGPLNKLFNKCFPGWKIGDLDINEVIGGYWESLDDDDLNWSIKEEEQFR
jgi:hypothetical protein